MFEGYVGIRLWDGQLVDDVIFSLLLSLLVAFDIIFRANYQHFIKMLKDVLYLKERQNLFDETVGKSETFFRHFMIFQALFLRSEEHTSELQSLMRISYAVFCLKKKKK